MGEVETLEISFENSRGVFDAGSRVKGTVTAKVKEAIDIRSIQLTITGECKVEWYIRQGKQNLRAQKNVVYINTTVCLCGVAENTETMKLSEGVHTYPFDFEVPATAPSSFEHKVAYVRYFCSAEIDRPKKFLKKNQTTLAYFTVIRHLDLNCASPDMRLPSEEQQGKSQVSCCLCVCRGEVHAKLQLNRKLFVPGDSVLVNAEVINNSAFAISSKVAIYQELKFDGTVYGAVVWCSRKDIDKEKSDKRAVVEKTLGRTKSHQSDKWTNESITVPALPPSDLEGCDPIHMSYHAELEVKVHCGKNIILSCPLTIGTIPLSAENQGHAPPGGKDASEVPSLYPTVALGDVSLHIDASSSYEECTFGRKQVRQKYTNKKGKSEPHEYAPMYAYYRPEKR